MLRRRKVQDIDFDRGTLIASIIATMAIGYWHSSVASYWGIIPPTKNNFPMLSSVVAPIVFIGILYKFMELNNIQARFMQTTIAFLIASAITTSLIIATTPYPSLFLIGSALLIVNIMVSVDIFKQAFEVSAARAFLYSIGLSLVSSFISMLIITFILDLTRNSLTQ